MKEAAFILLLAFCLIFPMFWVGVPMFGWFFVTVVVALGLWEGIAVLKTRRTLSQLFWAVSKKHPRKAIIALSILSVGWIALMFHLAAKL
jgi:hypothetical protein